MNINEITSLITTVGFPIVACGALFYQQNKMQEKYNATIADLTEVINSNTLALVELRDQLKKGELI